MNYSKAYLRRKKSSGKKVRKHFFPFLFSLSAMILYLGMHALSNNVSAQSFTQTIRGTIIDIDSQDPLIGAVVQIPSLNTGTTTDENGNFKIPDVPVGRYNIHVSYLGYEPQTLSEVSVTAGKEVIVNARLAESVKELKEVTVVYDRKNDKTVTNNDMTTVSARSFNIDDTKRYAGSLGDPSRMAANFAGVSGANDARNDIIIRGNSPAGLLWQLEGINIPNPNHFGSLSSTGGPVSMLNNNVLAKSDFLTGAFPAQYGNALSGVFDLGLRNGNNEHFEFLGQIGFNGFELGAEGPLSLNKKSSFLVNYRYSTLGVFQAIGLDLGTGSATPDYQDLNFKLNIAAGKGRISFFGLGGKSDISFLGNEADTTLNDFYSDRYSNTIVDYQTGVLGASYEINLSPKTFNKFTVAYTLHRESFHGDSISAITLEEFPSGNAEFNTDDYHVIYNLTHKFNAKNTIGTGITVDFLNYDLFNETIYDGVLHRTNIEASGSTILSQAFVQWKHRFSDKLTMKSGVNTMILSLNNSYAVNPRVGFTYRLNNAGNINLAYGLVSRMQPITLYDVQTPFENGYIETNTDLGFTNAHHGVIGYDRLVNDKLNIRIEAYYQYLYDIPVESTPSSYSAINGGNDFAPDLTDSLINEGTATNYGLELTIEKYFSDNYYFLLTGSLFDSKYRGSDGIERNTAFNTHYVTNLLGGKEFHVGRKNNVVGLDLKVTFSGGRYLTPIDFEASELEGSAVYREENAFTERQDPYFRTDVKMYFKKDFDRATMEFALDLQNVTNHKNVFSRDYDPYSNKIVTEYQQGFFPVPTFRLTF